MLYFTDVPGATQTTNATPNTANDCMFMTPGSLRSLWWTFIELQGRAAALTAVTGISARLIKWTSTAASGGSAITPTPTDPGYQAAKHTAGFSASTVVSGTGGPTLLNSVGCSQSGPGVWGNPTPNAGNLDQAYALQSGVTQSMDVQNISGTASMVFELTTGTAE